MTCKVNHSVQLTLAVMCIPLAFSGSSYAQLDKIKGFKGAIEKEKKKVEGLIGGGQGEGDVDGDAIAKDLSDKLQRAKSRLMGMQIDEAVALFAESTTLLDQLSSSDPDHKDLAKLQKKYDKLAGDLAKKVTQRAGRDINPMMGPVEKALSGDDADKLKRDRDKLADAIDQHRSNLESAGGDAGAALLADARKLLADADARLGAPPPESPAPVKPADSQQSAPAVASGEDPKQINSEIQRKFRSARSTRGGDNSRIEETAEEIRQLIERLRAADPNHNKLAEYEKKVDQMVADAHAADVQAASGEIERHTSRIEMYLERNREDERPQLNKHRQQLKETLEAHRAALEAAGDPGRDVIARTEAFIRESDERIGAALAGDALVNEWIAKLDPYHGSGEKDIGVGINSPAEYARVKQLRAEAQVVWDEYQQVTFPDGKTSTLETTEHYFRQSTEEADQNLAYAVASRAEGAQERIKRIADLFASDQDWKSDKSKQPRRFADELLEQARQSLDELAEYEADHVDLPELESRYAALSQENTERRNANKALTLLRGDKYKGADADDLKAFARKLVPKTHAGAEALRLTIFTEDWKEETVTEWTDSTHSALRTRTTRTLMFCVAFKDAEGVFRDFGYLNQNRQSGGEWGPTYGHLAKYRAPMLEENVAKDEPEDH